jgi:hypothetical protein
MTTEFRCTDCKDTIDAADLAWDEAEGTLAWCLDCDVERGAQVAIDWWDIYQSGRLDNSEIFTYDQDDYKSEVYLDDLLDRADEVRTAVLGG